MYESYTLDLCWNAPKERRQGDDGEHSSN
jgi:hypothetical protein